MPSHKVPLTHEMNYLKDYIALQPHRSYLVNVDQIQAIEGNRLIVGKYKVPISKYLKEEVLRQITGGKLFGK